MMQKNNIHPRVLGVITARGGSKGIPGKNIKPLLGKPLLLYTIEAAQKSGIFDRLIISTDDARAAELARANGVEVPFMRPPELAADATPHVPVMQHAVRWMEEHEGYVPDYVAALQPTSPLRQARHLKEAFELLKNTGVDSVLAVTEIPKHFHPRRAFLVDERGLLTIAGTGEPIRNVPKQRQDMSSVYTINGALFMFKKECLFHPTEPSLYGESVVAYKMDLRESVNIDDMNDWREAEDRLSEFKTI